ncbi:hypothetical protein [Pseudomonas sp. NPDC090208]|uniref:hypothetical protein n=1 Tax=Pseudomonas sp. NPDC090208 TaxID=3364478 RepID=UPI00381D0918
MSIVRVARKDTYYVLPSNVINDDRLSWEARGILVYLLSKQDNWKIRIKDLMARTANCLGKRSGRDKVYSLLIELQKAGYVVRQFDRMGGTFKSVSYEVYDEPNLEAGAAFIASLEKAQDSPFTDLPETVPPLPALPDTATPFTAKPDVIDSSETAFITEKALKVSTPAPDVDDEPGAQVLTDAERAALAQAPQNYPQSPTSKTFHTWLAYAMAFKERHRQWPVYNATVGAQLSKLITRIGAESAPVTARHFVEVINTPSVVENLHPIGTLLRHCESYAVKARAYERTQALRMVTEHMVKAAEQAGQAVTPPDPTPHTPNEPQNRLTTVGQQARAALGSIMGGKLKTRMTA